MVNKNYKNYNKFWKIIFYMLILLAVIIVIVPLIWMVAYSIRPNDEIFSIPPRIIPKSFEIKAYINVLTNSANLRSFMNSFIVSSVVTIFALLIASIGSYGFSRFNFIGKRFFTHVLLFVQMIPMIFLLLPFFMIVTWLRLYDTLFGLMVVYTTFNLSFCTLMMRNFFNSIPREIDEAALIDGCSWLQVLFKIILPLNVPAIISTGAFAFIFSWTELLFAVSLTSSTSMRTITVMLSTTVGQYAKQWNTLMAFATLSCIPVAIGWIFLQRYIIEGMMKGSMKY